LTPFFLVLRLSSSHGLSLTGAASVKPQRGVRERRYEKDVGGFLSKLERNLLTIKREREREVY
jgi:hypothetical protein